jgi:two-component system sensor histidine kinase AlgZ
LKPRTPLPPRTLPLFATVAVGACMALLALQVSGNADALAVRSLLLLCYALACLPLSALQRLLWQRGAPAWLTAWLLLATIAALALVSNLPLALRAHVVLGEPVAWSAATVLRGRGLDALAPALMVQAALHAAFNLAWARQAERERALAAEALAREAELRALRYQLQPHFLFNTLNAVSGLVAAGRGHQARELISRLADYLRSTLEADGRHHVPLAEELAHAADYLAIEQSRLGDRLRVRQQVEPGLLEQPTPRGVLQPLLENAMRHGLAHRAQGGRLDLLVRRAGDQVELDLLNDLPDDTAAAPADAASPRAGLGVGLANVRARLQALYPQAHVLQTGRVQTPDGPRWQVRLRWPLAA